MRQRQRATVLTMFVTVLGGSACLPTELGRDAQGGRGAVTAGHPLAAAAGLSVLQDGGNAMDAAITMAAVLAVARPHMNGVAGDMFMLYYHAGSGTVYALNASGPAGTAATLTELREQGLDSMPTTGPKSVSVPGAVRGWEAALTRFGTYEWSKALAPAVALARDGLPVSERLSLDITAQASKLRDEPPAASIFLPGDSAPPTGSRLLTEDLAETFSRIQQNGADEMYSGETASHIVEYLTERGGLLTADDLSSYEVTWTEPIRTQYHDVEVLAFPPNTQGVALLEELELVERFDMVLLGHNTSDYLHTISEAIRIAVHDRDTSVADPTAMRVTVDELLDAQRLAQLSAGIDPAGRAPGAVAMADEDHPNTVYLTAVDEAGNVVSLIQSLFHSFGSGLVVPGTGVVLHNRGSLFRFDESHPNVFAPGRLPYHTLSPAMVLRGGHPWMAFGTPGGDGQTHTLLQVLHNIMFFGMTPQQAIDAPRIRRLPDGSLAVEDRIPETIRQELESRGYIVHARAGWTAEFGGAQATIIENGWKRAGADRRREAFSVAY